MNYILEPLNENQDMNCMVKFSGSKSAAGKKAIGIAAALQAQLDGASITCRVRKTAVNSSAYTDEAGGFIATATGAVLDEASGNPVKL